MFLRWVYLIRWRNIQLGVQRSFDHYRHVFLEETRDVLTGDVRRRAEVKDNTSCLLSAARPLHSSETQVFLSVLTRLLTNVMLIRNRFIVKMFQPGRTESPDQKRPPGPLAPEQHEKICSVLLVLSQAEELLRAHFDELVQLVLHLLELLQNHQEPEWVPEQEAVDRLASEEPDPKFDRRTQRKSSRRCHI